MEYGKCDFSRVGKSENFEKIMKTLNELQAPCPWGDLTKREDGGEHGSFMDSFKIATVVPIGLSVGCGYSPMEELYAYNTRIGGFGYFLHSDVIGPADMGDDYIKIDLTRPEEIHLFGNKVHAVMGSMVFTYDGYGVNFKDINNEMNCISSLDDLLMPGGLMMNMHHLNDRFSKILQEEFDYNFITTNICNADILQKPF